MGLPEVSPPIGDRNLVWRPCFPAGCHLSISGLPDAPVLFRSAEREGIHGESVARPPGSVQFLLNVPEANGHTGNPGAGRYQRVVRTRDWQQRPGCQPGRTLMSLETGRNWLVPRPRKPSPIRCRAGLSIKAVSGGSRHSARSGDAVMRNRESGIMAITGIFPCRGYVPNRTIFPLRMAYIIHQQGKISNSFATG